MCGLLRQQTRVCVAFCVLRFAFNSLRVAVGSTDCGGLKLAPTCVWEIPLYGRSKQHRVSNSVPFESKLIQATSTILPIKFSRDICCPTCKSLQSWVSTSTTTYLRSADAGRSSADKFLSQSLLDTGHKPPADLTFSSYEEAKFPAEQCFPSLGLQARKKSSGILYRTCKGSSKSI
jgi:hypothetical protein